MRRKFLVVALALGVVIFLAVSIINAHRIEGVYVLYSPVQLKNQITVDFRNDGTAYLSLEGNITKLWWKRSGKRIRATNCPPASSFSGEVTTDFQPVAEVNEWDFEIEGSDLVRHGFRFHKVH